MNAAARQIEPASEAFHRFVTALEGVRDAHGAHPCVMARSVVARGNYASGEYGRLGERAAAAACRRDLAAALAAHAQDATPWSFIAFFDESAPRDEPAFEAALWRHLQAMHEIDVRYCRWDPSVSADPEDPRFSFSIGGAAWYVIGLHPRASRRARRFGRVALVFNPHRQFEHLREQGKYAAVRGAVRARDRALQGSVNPMLADFGELSEARQYSGRAVEEGWSCPFHRSGAAAPAPQP